MPRKRIQREYSVPGRPPKQLADKVGTSVRCLVTVGVRNALDVGAGIHGIIVSDYLRLALFNQMAHDGILTDELRKDATWEELRKQAQA